MILGKFKKDEKMTRLNLEIFCTNCGKKIPGGIKTGEKHAKTKEFIEEIKIFKKNYLCGICRDKKRITQK